MESAKQYRYIYLYGAGYYGRRLLRAYADRSIYVTAVVVTSKAGNPDKIGRYPVRVIDEIYTAPRDSLFIIGAGAEKCGEMTARLKSMGYYNIVRPPVEKRFYESLNNRPKMEITTRAGCAVNCRFCPQDLFCSRYLKGGKPDTLMSAETFRICLDKIPKDGIITFSGFCEPFLNQNCIDMMEYAVSQGREIEIYTTLMGVTREIAQRIVKLPIKTFVLHTPDSEGYANILVSKEYFAVLDIILDSVRDNGIPLVDSANCQGIPSLEILDYIRGRVVVKSDLCDRAGSLSEEQLKKTDYLSGLIECTKMKKFNQWVLLPDGRVVLCCMDFGLRHVLGNLRQQSYDEIIGGDILKNMENGLSDETMGILCRECTSARECSRSIKR